MSTQRDILVLLSTYNGERFLGEQLRSLREQTVAERVKVLVRDDGSGDGTLAVARGFDPGPLEIEVVGGENLGVIGSFRELMRLADSGPEAQDRVFMFCDQDDFWLPDKCEVADRAVRDLPQDQPALYESRSTVCDADLNPIRDTDGAPKGLSLRNALVQNVASGHTMACNLAALRLARDTLDADKAIMHDYWLHTVTLALGNAVFDDTSRVRYRVHGVNAVASGGFYPVGRLQRLWAALRRQFTLDRTPHTVQARLLRDALGERLTEPDRAVVYGFCDQSTVVGRLRYVLAYPLLFQALRFAVVPNLWFVLGRYRPRQGRDTRSPAPGQ